MENFILYGFTIILLLYSLYKDKNKTKKALLKAWKSFRGILPEFLGVISFVGIMLSIVNPQAISKLIGNASGWWGVVISSIVGAITLIPGFIAFSTSAALLENGAGYTQMGAFISSLMMVGVMTYPVEVKYFGKKTALLRNVFSFIFSYFVAFVIGKVMG